MRAEKDRVDILDHLLHSSEVLYKPHIFGRKPLFCMVVDLGLLPRTEMRDVEV
jgi:hypothetical protein